MEESLNEKLQVLQAEVDNATCKAADIQCLLDCLSKSGDDVDAGSMARAIGIAAELMRSLTVDLSNIYIPKGASQIERS